MKAKDLPELEAMDARQRRVVLYLDGISVSFDGFKALKNLSLTVDEGELRCVIGPNGAGKTTMMDVITGKTREEPSSASRRTSRAFRKPRSPTPASAASSRSRPSSSRSQCSRTSSLQ
jgi:ABC-type uncharacterized transport system ATPase subunit